MMVIIERHRSKVVTFLNLIKLQSLMETFSSPYAPKFTSRQGEYQVGQGRTAEQENSLHDCNWCEGHVNLRQHEGAYQLCR